MYTNWMRYYYYCKISYIFFGSEKLVLEEKGFSFNYMSIIERLWAVTNFPFAFFLVLFFVLFCFVFVLFCFVLFLFLFFTFVLFFNLSYFCIIKSPCLNPSFSKDYYVDNVLLLLQVLL